MPDTTRVCFHIKDIGYGLSHAMSGLETEDTVTVSFPHGKAVLQAGSTRPIIAIGGGLGLAPLLPIIKTALHHMPAREILLFHGGVTAADLYLEPVLQELSSRYQNLSYTGVTENPINGFATGLVSDVANRQLPDDLSGYEAYLSGAPAMVEACLAPLLDKGLSRDLVFSDSL
jgi:NAD(P)H-flavin reductase